MYGTAGSDGTVAATTIRVGEVGGRGGFGGPPGMNTGNGTGTANGTGTGTANAPSGTSRTPRQNGTAQNGTAQSGAAQSGAAQQQSFGPMTRSGAS